jgi:hypothetical protein
VYKGQLQPKVNRGHLVSLRKNVCAEGLPQECLIPQKNERSPAGQNWKADFILQCFLKANYVLGMLESWNAGQGTNTAGRQL